MTLSVVTGSSTGIGYATALRLAREGHHVIATMRTPDACDIETVAAGENLNLEARKLDVTDQSDVDELFSGIHREHGAVDVLVNNAGISRGRTVEEAAIEAFVETIETNYIGALRCTKAVLPPMREKGSGCIVAVTSQAGRLAAPALGPYNGSKWAIEGAMETLAIEVAEHGIRVAMIEPGAILTPMVGKADMPPTDTPYEPVYRRFLSVAMHDFGRGSSADVVADTVFEAITTDSPKLRWRCGQGAERNLSTRAAMSDEDWIALWNGADEEAFLEELLGDEARAPQTPPSG